MSREVSSDLPEDSLALRKRSFLNLALTLLFLILIAIFAITHTRETREFLALLGNADTGWMVLAVFLQIPTYIFTGIVWKLSAEAVNYKLDLKTVSELAVEQLSVSQLVPSAGLAGNIIVIRAMRRFGLPLPLAIEIFFIETLSYYLAFLAVALISIVFLWLHGNITPIISSLASAFFVITALVTLLIWSAANHKKLRILDWVRSRKIFSRFFSLFENISSTRVFSPSLLFQTSIFRLGVFVLDAFSLFAILEAIGVESNFTTSFVALVIASMAGTVTLMPGGLGGYEAASILILNLFGVPITEAIAATALFRCLTLWLPLIPGIILARKDWGMT